MTYRFAELVRRLWTAFRDSSAAAVAIHYDAPWNLPPASTHRDRSPCAA
ncbi:hypothetical protein [Sphingopyxis sp. 113P3]|jgi:hypothetical protein|nr:hypothetical protein [Sphingopyxis sp. 113P3]